MFWPPLTYIRTYNNIINQPFNQQYRNTDDRCDRLMKCKRTEVSLLALINLWWLHFFNGTYNLSEHLSWYSSFSLFVSFCIIPPMMWVTCVCGCVYLNCSYLRNLLVLWSGLRCTLRSVLWSCLWIWSSITKYVCFVGFPVIAI